MADTIGDRPGFGSLAYRREIGCPEGCVYDGQFDCLFNLDSEPYGSVINQAQMCSAQQRWREGKELEYEQDRRRTYKFR